MEITVFQVGIKRHIYCIVNYCDGILGNHNLKLVENGIYIAMFFTMTAYLKIKVSSS